MTGRHRLSGMGTFKTAAVAVLGVLLLSACGQEAATTPGAGTSSEPVSTSQPTSEPGDQPISKPPVSADPTGGVVVPDGIRQLPRSQVDARDVPEYWNHRGVVWVYDEGHSLQTFAVANSGCAGAEAEIVDQLADVVRIRLRSVPPEDKSRICTAVEVPKPVSVRLNEPIGNRTLVLSTT